MKHIAFSVKPFDRRYLLGAAEDVGLEITPLEARLTPATAGLAQGASTASLFIYDTADAEILESLHAGGVRMLALRSAGFNHVDLAAADRLGITIARVPAYSPNAVAEHAAALVLTLNRKTHKAYNRVRENNFSIDGLMGFDLSTRTVGIIGLGKIGACFARIMAGFGCQIVVSDPNATPDHLPDGAEIVAPDELFRRADIVSLHCPLTPSTKHIIDEAAFGSMRRGAMLINTSRGALVDSRAAIGALKSGQLGSLGLDVYEEEGDLFFQDLSDQVIQDDTLARLMTFPNVLVTAHQAFFTHEAVEAIARTTVSNLSAYENSGEEGIPAENLVCYQSHAR